MKKIIERSPNLMIFTEWQFGLFEAVKDRKLFDKVVSYLFQKGYKIYQVLPRGDCALPTFDEKKTI